MSEILQYKLRIKEWEKNFALNNGRLPSKADVKADAEIRKAYKAYNAMKKGDVNPHSSTEKSGNTPKNSSQKGTDGKNARKASGSAQKKSKNIDSSRSRLPQSPISESNLYSDGPNPKNDSTFDSVDIQLTDDEEYEPLMPVYNAELGPTPQANGKVLSIFDMILSPPESSPIKTSKNFGVLESTSPFRTPTKSVKRINLGDVTPSRGPSLAEKLRLASSPSNPAESPKSLAQNDIPETPRYLGKVNNKFSFHESDSPSSASTSKPFAFTTPTKPVPIENFQVSPSPLKSQRFLQTRLSDIYLAHQNLATDEAFEAQKREFEKEFETPEEPEVEEAPTMEHLRDMKRRKKATTQKRTTRRWKIKPRGEGDQNDTLEGKDIHEEMQKMDSEERSDLAKYMDGEVSSESSEEDQEIVVRKDPPSTKINAISNNYQRLKINDPRAKKFKQRMKRR